ncbi:MAG: hypothetical protein ACPGJS_05545 [Flammeovirgaceae bacterium]
MDNTALIQKINDDLPTNGQKGITALALRNVLIEMVNSSGDGNAFVAAGSGAPASLVGNVTTGPVLYVDVIQRDLYIWNDATIPGVWEVFSSGFQSAVTANGDGTYTHSDGNGTDTIIDTNKTATDIGYDNTSANLNATDVQAAIDELKDIAGRKRLDLRFFPSLEDVNEISFKGANTTLIDLDYDTTHEVNDSLVTIEVRKAGENTFASLTNSSTWADTVNAWIASNITTERFYLRIQLPAQATQTLGYHATLTYAQNITS